MDTRIDATYFKQVCTFVTRQHGHFHSFHKGITMKMISSRTVSLLKLKLMTLYCITRDCGGKKNPVKSIYKLD